MRKGITLTLIVALGMGLAGIALAQQEKEEKDLQRMVEDLGSSSFGVREKAMDGLREAKENAIPHLEEGMKHEDPEIRWRAEALLRDIREKDGKRQKRGGIRFFDGGIDLDGDGKPDFRFPRIEDPDLPDLKELRERMLKDLDRPFRDLRELLKERDLQWPGFGRNPGFNFDIQRGSQGFRYRMNPDGSFNMEVLKDGKWVPADGASPSGTSLYRMTLGRPGEALRAQLSIPEGTGLVVTDLAPDGEAAAAGIQRFDVILTVNGDKVSGPDTFDGKIAATPEGEDAALQLYRKAELVEIKLPVQRVRRY